LLLQPFITNLDRAVFGLRNLPEVVKGALFSRYSRSDKSLRFILLDEFIKAPEASFALPVGKITNSNTEQLVSYPRMEVASVEGVAWQFNKQRHFMIEFCLVMAMTQ
jgi:predicted transposase YdaD